MLKSVISLVFLAMVSAFGVACSGASTPAEGVESAEEALATPDGGRITVDGGTLSEKSCPKYPPPCPGGRSCDWTCVDGEWVLAAR